MKNAAILVILNFFFAFAEIIDSISFVGHVKTKDEYLQKLVSPILKTQYSAASDTAIFDALAKTRIFSEIIIVPSLIKETGDVLIFVVLKEDDNFSLSGIGAGLISTMYGENTDEFRPYINLSAEYNNFLGIGHKLYWETGIWDNRFLGMYWYIPVGISPYFFDVGGVFGKRPSFVFQWELSPFVNTNFRFGRNISKEQLVFFEISPTYKKYNIMEKQRSEWQVSRVGDEFWEIYNKLSYTFSISDNKYPPLFATFAQISLKTNALKSFEDKRLLEISGDFKQNIPISQRARHSVFAQARFTLTPFGEHNKYDGLLTGGMDFVRGWDDDIIGSLDNILYDIIFDNRILGTLEYQFHILTLPPFKLGFLSWYDKSMSDFTPQITGAIFLDGGFLYKKITSPISSENANAASAGISIRVLQPHIRTGGSVEFAWQIRGSQRYLNENRNAPVIHIGLITQF
jgi:outer membrane protein assembly factor BamA